MPRKLPGWMEKSTASSCDSGECKPNSILPILKLPTTCRVVYSYQSQDCNLLCSEILTIVKKNLNVLALDAEWPVTYGADGGSKVAVLQICPSSDFCFVFHISEMGGIPKALLCLLEDPQITKVGLNISGDLWKLHRDFDNVSSKVLESHLELSDFANKVLNSSQKWSLTRLCRHVLSKDLPKETSVRKGRWDSFPLSEDQLNYSALDAFVSLLLYNELDKKLKSVK